MDVSYTVEEEHIDWIVGMAEMRGDPVSKDIVRQVLQLSEEFEEHKGRAIRVVGPCRKEVFLPIGDDIETQREHLACLLCMARHGVTVEGDGREHTSECPL